MDSATVAILSPAFVVLTACIAQLYRRTSLHAEKCEQGREQDKLEFRAFQSEVRAEAQKNSERMTQILMQAHETNAQCASAMSEMADATEGFKELAFKNGQMIHELRRQLGVKKDGETSEFYRGRTPAHGTQDETTLIKREEQS